MSGGVPFDATGLLRGYARYRLARLAKQDAAAEQQRQLLWLVRRAAGTKFGGDHGFDNIRSVADFQRLVALSNYEKMWDGYWSAAFPRLTDCTWPGTIPYFALTSGTTSGTTKYIPCSAEMNRANSWAAIEILVHHVANHPNSRVMGGKSFMLGGSTELTELSPGIRSGDLSGIASSRIPWWARQYSFPPNDLALIADWEAKVERLVDACRDQDVRAISGTPSWLVIFFEHLFARHEGHPTRLHQVFPDLELLVHGGVNFAPYRRRFGELLEGSHAELREVYPASEGFFAIADRACGEGMRLIVDNGLFYEFVEVSGVESGNPSRHWIADVRTGVDYALVVSSCAGLWAYVVGDIVRFVDLHPPRLLVTGRLSYSLSAFGEHLTGEEIDLAIGSAAEAVGSSITDFAVGVVFPDGTDPRGGHVYVVEFDKTPERVDEFACMLDQALSRGNDDYRAHRSDGFGLRAPTVIAVPTGTFAAWMRRRGQLGGQHKVPRIINDESLFEDLRRFASKPG